MLVQSLLSTGLKQSGFGVVLVSRLQQGPTAPLYPRAASPRHPGMALTAICKLGSDVLTQKPKETGSQVTVLIK